MSTTRTVSSAGLLCNAYRPESDYTKRHHLVNKGLGDDKQTYLDKTNRAVVYQQQKGNRLGRNRSDHDYNSAEVDMDKSKTAGTGKRLSKQSRNRSEDDDKRQRTQVKGNVSTVPAGPLVPAQRSTNSSLTNVNNVMRENQTVNQLPIQDEKLSFNDLCAQKGIDARRTYQNCQYRTSVISPHSSIRQFAIINMINFPEGYSEDDITASQRQASQPSEEVPVSPAVILASQRRKDKINNKTPKIRPDDFINNLKRNSRPNDNQEKEELIPEATNLETTFPDDSFNESLLYRASQQAEDEADMLANQDECRKRDSGNSRSEMNESLANNELEANTPKFTSTPIVGGNLDHVDASISKETPKIRGKARLSSLSRSRNRSKSTASNSSNIFESSEVEKFDVVSPIRTEGCNNMETPRKQLKFDPAPTTLQTSRIGDFEDDGNDELFSQIAMQSHSSSSESFDKSQAEDSCKKNDRSSWKGDSGIQSVSSTPRNTFRRQGLKRPSKK